MRPRPDTPPTPLTQEERRIVLEAWEHGGSFARRFAEAILHGDPSNQRILVECARRDMPAMWARWADLARWRAEATEMQEVL